MEGTSLENFLKGKSTEEIPWDDSFMDFLKGFGKDLSPNPIDRNFELESGPRESYCSEVHYNSTHKIGKIKFRHDEYSIDNKIFKSNSGRGRVLRCLIRNLNSEVKNDKLLSMASYGGSIACPVEAIHHIQKRINNFDTGLYLKKTDQGYKLTIKEKKP